MSTFVFVAWAAAGGLPAEERPSPPPATTVRVAEGGVTRIGLGDVVHFEAVGPTLDESSDVNPATDMLFLIAIGQGRTEIVVPGYFAADGRAAETGATGGSVWRASVLLPGPGEWAWAATLRRGPNVRIALDRAEGAALPGDGRTGTVRVEPRAGAEGVLGRGPGRYPTFAHSGRVFLKAGTDSPENLLAYVDFDQTATLKPGARLHAYAPHAGDARADDPTWGGRGRNLLGAINYLADQGVNSLYFLTMNRFGDGDDVWPWTGPDERRRFDVSKLDQWDRVFAHAEARGIGLHVVLTETENESLFEAEQAGRERPGPPPADADPTVALTPEDSTFADERRLYYLELVSRFGHHRNVTWNIGEENGMADRNARQATNPGRPNTDAQRLAFAGFLRQIDPHDHPIVVHTKPGGYEAVYRPLLGSHAYDGASLQMGDMTATHAETLKWVRESAAAGRPWTVCLDEIGPANTGVVPDADDPGHDAVRRHALWGNLMAGGGGAEWYFGYKYPHNDLTCNDFRSREAMWRQGRAAVAFFSREVPLDRVEPADELADGEGVWCLADVGSFYLVYVPPRVEGSVDVRSNLYRVSAFSARTMEPVGPAPVDLASEPVARVTFPPADEDRVYLIRSVPPASR